MSDESKIEGAERIDGRDVVTDSESVARDDLTTAQVGDADVHDPPVRSALPVGEVADAVGVGQGAHTPPDPAVFAPDGRVRDNEAPSTAVADNADGSADGTTGTGADPSGDEARARIDRGVATEFGGSDAGGLSEGRSDAPASSGGDDGELRGDALDARAAELGVDTSTGGSNADGSLNADEKRAAIAERE